jgi:hypothetical protein
MRTAHFPHPTAFQGLSHRLPRLVSETFKKFSHYLFFSPTSYHILAQSWRESEEWGIHPPAEGSTVLNRPAIGLGDLYFYPVTICSAVDIVFVIKPVLPNSGRVYA